MSRNLTPALILSVAVHLAAAAGYWLWGGQPAGHELLPTVDVVLVAEVAMPVERVDAPSEPETRLSERDPEPEPIATPAPRAPSPPAEPSQPPLTQSPSRPTPTVARPVPIDPGLLASIEQAYKSALQAEIARHRHYPHIARRMRHEGTVEVGFVVLADGRLTAIEVLKSSGHRLLDEAAVQAVREVGQFRPIPAELARTRWPLSVPLNFRLL